MLDKNCLQIIEDIENVFLNFEKHNYDYEIQKEVLLRPNLSKHPKIKQRLIEALDSSIYLSFSEDKLPILQIGKNFKFQNELVSEIEPLFKKLSSTVVLLLDCNYCFDILEEETYFTLLVEKSLETIQF